MVLPPIRTCVIGSGMSGIVFQVPFILALPDLFTLHAVLERTPVGKGKINTRFSLSVQVYNSLDQVLADSQVELVVVGTPNDTHFSIAKACLDAGKHVLVDKPVTVTSRQAKDLGEIAKAKGLVLYAFQNRRWDADFLALKGLLNLPESAPNSIGTIVEFESHYDRYRTTVSTTWKDQYIPGSGATYNLGSHLIDQTLTLFGRPQKLTAFLENVRGLGHPDVEDCFTIHMHYPPGPVFKQPFTAILRAHILSARSPQVRFIVRGTRGTFTKFGVDPQEDELKVIENPSLILSEEYGKEAESLWGQVQILAADGVSTTTSVWPSDDPGRYIDLYRNLAAVIRDGAEQTVKWEEATAVIEIIELAHKSSKEGTTVTC